MRGAAGLVSFLRTGSLGVLHTGVPYADILKLLGPAEACINDVNPVYRYSQIEIYVNGTTGVIWMVQLEPFNGMVKVPSPLEAGSYIDIPPNRAALVSFLDKWGIVHDIGEFHVTGQEELRIQESGVFVFYADDGQVTSLVAEGPLPR